MHFLVFGATGACGTEFCNLALDKDHKITVLVRNTDKLSQRLSQSGNVQVIQGTLDDEACLEKAFQCGADAFISFAGPPYGGEGTPLTDGYQKLIPTLHSQGIKRVLILCTPSFTCDSDTAPFMWRLGKWFMRTFSFSQYQEMVSIGTYVSSLSSDDVQWTLFRVGGLTNGPDAAVEAAYLGGERGTMSISRASIAKWVLDESLENRWVGECPYICNV